MPVINVTHSEITLAGIGYRVEALDSSDEDKDQDAHLVISDFAGVADGATPLGEQEPGVPDPKALATAALDALAEWKSLPAKALFAAAINDVRNRLFLTVPTERSSIPSCTVAIVRPDGDGIQANVLGDCLVIADTGRVRVVADARLRRVDDSAIDRLKDELAHKRSVEAARHAITPILRRNRSTMNTDEGYYVFSADIDAARHVRVGHFRNHPTALLLASDGFVRLVDVFHKYRSRTTLLHAALELGLGRMARELRMLEGMPGSDRRYPRFSQFDDATALLLKRV